MSSALKGIQDGVKLKGSVWIDELYKTHRRMDEKKKCRISRQQTPIYVAVDSCHGILFLKGRENGKQTMEDAKEVIMTHLGKEISTITTDRNNCYSFLDELEYRHESIKADVGSPEYEAKIWPMND